MTFWPLTNSDFPINQTFHQIHDIDTDFDLHRITSGFHGALATSVACQQGTLTLPDTWLRPPFWDLQMLQLLRPNSSHLPCLYSTFHLEYPLVLSRFCFVLIFQEVKILFQTSLKIYGISWAQLIWNRGIKKFVFPWWFRTHWSNLWRKYAY